MTKFLLLYLLVGSFVSVGAAQAKIITGQEFSDTYFDALARSQERSRRHTSKLEHFVNGRLSKTSEWRAEYLMPYSRRNIYREASPDQRVYIEEVNVGEDAFCREGTGTWKRIVESCMKRDATRSQAAFQVMGKISSGYLVEEVEIEGKRLMRFRENLTYKNQAPAAKGQTWTAENSYWLDTDGSLVRQEIRTGRLGEKLPSAIWTDTYVYDPVDLKIEVPIK